MRRDILKKFVSFQKSAEESHHSNAIFLFFPSPPSQTLSKHFERSDICRRSTDVFSLFSRLLSFRDPRREKIPRMCRFEKGDFSLYARPINPALLDRLNPCAVNERTNSLRKAHVRFAQRKRTRALELIFFRRVFVARP